MDFIFWSAIKDARVEEVMLSYDIGCQYKINLEERRKIVLLPLRRTPTSPDVAVILPIWHGDVHKPECKTVNSLLCHDGGGKSDGEAPERLWAILNQIAWQTKEMQPEVRHDAIEDKVDRHNHQKNVGLGILSLPLYHTLLSGSIFAGSTLQSRLTIAVEERNIQIKEFQDIDSTLQKSLRADWLKMVEEWQADHSKLSPYLSRIFGHKCDYFVH